MNIQMTAGEALQAFCRAWFVERDVEAAMAFIREDVDFVGTGDRRVSTGAGMRCFPTSDRICWRFRSRLYCF